MPSLFPGMDPYVERPQIWADFHDRFVTHLTESLQPYLRPRYIALTQDRLYVVEHERPIRPDVSVVQTSTESEHGGVATAVAAEPDTPYVVELVEEEIRQPVIHIIEPAADGRIITAIEVLSPDNKSPGAGRNTYLRKCDELWHADSHLVEIDLLRGGQRTLRVSDEKLAELPSWRYVVSVLRRPSRCEVYTFALQNRLPSVSIPLSGDDPDVILDLQSVFTRCWDAGPYPELLRYEEPPPGELSDEELAWCRSKLHMPWAAKEVSRAEFNEKESDDESRHSKE